MQETTFAGLEKLFLALSDKTRMQLLTLMAGGEVSVGYLAEALAQSQPKISRHLAYLRNMGLVTTRRDGKWIYYGINVEAPQAISRILAATIDVLADQNISNSITISRFDGRAVEIGPDRDNDLLPKDLSDADEWRPSEIEIYLL